MKKRILITSSRHFRIYIDERMFRIQLVNLSPESYAKIAVSGKRSYMRTSRSISQIDFFNEGVSCYLDEHFFYASTLAEKMLETNL